MKFTKKDTTELKRLISNSMLILAQSNKPSDTEFYKGMENIIKALVIINNAEKRPDTSRQAYTQGYDEGVADGYDLYKQNHAYCDLIKHG